MSVHDFIEGQEERCVMLNEKSLDRKSVKQCASLVSV